MIVVDGFLPNPEEARQMGLSAPYIDWHGPDGEVYKRICITDVPGVRDGIERAVGPVEMLGMGFRLNFNGELPNAAVHSDMGWGTHALVLYLNDGIGGTAFWRHRATGARRIDPGDFDLFEAVRNDWDDESKWEQTGLCEMAFNRAVIYESALFHSRYPFAAFGNDAESGRLIVVAFFNLKEGNDPASHA